MSNKDASIGKCLSPQQTDTHNDVQLVTTWICTSLIDLMVHADWALPSNRELQLSFIQVMKHTLCITNTSVPS